ncbi:MAG: protein-L-isoaspartate(D-aspartate) O-methyltransferase [Pseudomonadota bacterium]|nr:protein-L-isoaspartate(D-aspartate) O-methyltransferase [Pseudomonadota bacterium]
MNNMEQARYNMVEQQVRPCNIHDENVLDLFIKLKREKFAPALYQELAFSDLEVPLPGGQAMLSPRVEAMLLQELAITKTDKILEIGTGSGYITALLAKMADFVYSIEINEINRQLAIKNLTYAGINNVSVIAGDGLEGLLSKAPFDKILLGGGLSSVPALLKSQLKINGKLIGLFGTRPVLSAVLVERVGENKYTDKKLFETDVEYLVGEHIAQFRF